MANVAHFPQKSMVYTQKTGIQAGVSAVLAANKVNADT
jgi:hypothetical protein